MIGWSKANILIWINFYIDLSMIYYIHYVNLDESDKLVVYYVTTIILVNFSIYSNR